MTVLLGMVLSGAVSAAELTGIGQDIAREQKLVLSVEVEIHEPWRDEYVVNAYAFVDGPYLRIVVGPLLADALYGDGKLGFMAHELAHTRQDCGPRYETWDERHACEKRADALAVRWVGKRAVQQGLCQMMSASFYWRYKTDVSDLIDRIRHVHDLPQDPR